MKHRFRALLAAIVLIALLAAPASAQVGTTNVSQNNTYTITNVLSVSTTPCGLDGISYFGKSPWTVHVVNHSGSDCLVGVGIYDMRGTSSLKDGYQLLLGRQFVILGAGRETELSVPEYNGVCRAQRDVVSIVPGKSEEWLAQADLVMPWKLDNDHQKNQYDALVSNSVKGGQAETLNNEGGLCPTSYPPVLLCPPLTLVSTSTPVPPTATVAPSPTATKTAALVLQSNPIWTEATSVTGQIAVVKTAKAGRNLGRRLFSDAQSLQQSYPQLLADKTWATFIEFINDVASAGKLGEMHELGFELLGVERALFKAYNP